MKLLKHRTIQLANRMIRIMPSLLSFHEATSVFGSYDNVPSNQSLCGSFSVIFGSLNRL